jgi:hypothetical protein
MYVSKGNRIGSTTTILSFEVIREYKNKIVKFLNDMVDGFNKSEYPSIIDTSKIDKETEEYLYSIQIQSILENTDKLANMLKKTSLIDKEFFDFLEIQQITEHILKNYSYEDIDVKEIIFIRKLFEIFGELIYNKTDLFDDISSEDQITEEIKSQYKQKYALFDEKFSKYKEQFYLEMYTPSGKHKKTINDLYAIMKE